METHPIEAPASVVAPHKRRLAGPSALARIVLLSGFVLCVAVFDVGTIKPFDIAKMFAIWSCAWLALGLWLLDVARGRAETVWPKMGWAAGSFLAASGIATLFSRAHLVSFFGLYGRYNGFIELLMNVMIFLLIVQLYWKRPERIAEVLYAIGAASSIAVIYIMIQKLGLDPFDWRLAGGKSPGAKYIGTLGNGNFAGGFIGATLPWLLLLYWRSTKRWQTLLILAWGAVTVYGLWLASSRGGLLAGLAAAAVSAFVFRSRFPRKLFIAGVAAGCVVVIIGLGVALFGGPSKPRVGVGRRNVFASATLHTRLFWWRAALDMFATRPITGYGPESFMLVYPQHIVRESAGAEAVESSDKPHNVFLEHAATMGILGIGSYLALIGLAGLWGARRVFKVKGVHQDLLGCSLALLAGYLTQAFFSIDVVSLAVLGWIAFACVAVLADPDLTQRRGQDPDDALPIARAGTQRSLLYVAAVMSVIAASLATTILVADHYAKYGQDLNRKKSASEASFRRAFDRAITLAPYQPVYQGLYGTLLANRAERYHGAKKHQLLTDAIMHLRRLGELQPNSHLWLMSLGDVLSMAGDSGDVDAFVEGDAIYQRAHELAPYDWRVQTRYGDMLATWGRDARSGLIECQAVVQFKEALQLRDTDAKTWLGLARAEAVLQRFDAAYAAAEHALDRNPDNNDALIFERQLVELRTKKATPIVCPQDR